MTTTSTVNTVGRESERRARAGGGGPRERLGRDEKILLVVLALPTLALALAITIVSTYLSEVTRRFTHQTVVIGAIIGGEGVMALWVPLIAGPWSDRLRTGIGGRLPFVIAGTIPAAVGVALIGFVHTLGLVTLCAAVFFGFYFVAYEPIAPCIQTCSTRSGSPAAHRVRRRSRAGSALGLRCWAVVSC